MAWIRWRKVSTSAALVPAPPPPTTIHHHGTNWPAIIFTGFLCFLALLPVLWLVLVFLFSELGSRNPGRDAAGLFIYPLLGLGGLAAIKWLLSDWYAHTERIEELRAEASYNNMLISGQHTTTDYGRNQRKAAIIKTIMAQVYRDLRNNAIPYANGSSRPWSKRQAEGVLLPGLGKISQAEAGQVREWLLEFQMISDDRTNSQPNFRKYPNYEAAVSAVDARYRVTLVRSGAMMESDGKEFYGDFSRS